MARARFDETGQIGETGNVSIAAAGNTLLIQNNTFSAVTLTFTGSGTGLGANYLTGASGVGGDPGEGGAGRTTYSWDTVLTRHTPSSANDPVFTIKMPAGASVPLQMTNSGATAETLTLGPDNGSTTHRTYVHDNQAIYFATV